MANSLFIKADEVAELLGVSRAEAYRIIKRLNDQLSSRGFIVVNGRVNRKYLESTPQDPPKNQAIADNRSIEQRICIKPVKRSRQRDLSLLVRFMQRRATPITQKDVSRR